MAQLCQAYTLTRTWRSSVPCYKRNFRVNFFFSDHFFWVAQMAQWFFELLSLVLLTNRCAKGYGTAWHSQISIDFTRFSSSEWAKKMTIACFGQCLSQWLYFEGQKIIFILHILYFGHPVYQFLLKIKTWNF